MKKILYSMIMTLTFLTISNLNAQNLCEDLGLYEGTTDWSSELYNSDGKPLFTNICGENGRMILTKFFAAGPEANVPMNTRMKFQYNDILYTSPKITYTKPITGDIIEIIPNIYSITLPNNPASISIAEVIIPIEVLQENYKVEFSVWPTEPNNGSIDLFAFSMDLEDPPSQSWISCTEYNQYYDIDYLFKGNAAEYLYDEIVDPNNTLVSNGAITLSPPSTTNAHLRVETDLIVDTDLILNGPNNPGKEKRITMMPNAQIVVTNNSTLTLRNRKIQGCDAPWNSIIVENGSTLIADENVTFDNAISAITLEPGASLQLGGTMEVGANPETKFFDCTNGILVMDGGSISSNIQMEDATFDNCTIGMNLEGKSIISLFDNNTFENCSRGIRLDNANVPSLNFIVTNLSPSVASNKNTFDSCSRGVEISEANAMIRNNKFLNCSTAAVAIDSDASYFERNDVEYKRRGFWGINSSFRIYDNSFTHVDPIPYFDIAAISTLGGCNSSEIDSNTINAPIRGIQTRGGVDFTISNNSIEINGPNSNSIGAGIEMLSSDLDVFGNTMELTHADGITITTSMADKNLEQSIGHNTINSLDGFNKSGIRIDGSTDFTLKYNLICGDFADGIRILNSGHNTYECNDITTNVRGIFVADNSTFQEVLGNTTASYSSVHAGKNNILLRSEIGLQEHHSNVFLGDNNQSECSTELAQSWVRADGLTNSNFIYDPNVSSNQAPLIPQNHSPAGLFNPDLALPGERFMCDEGAAGVLVKGPFVESDVLCEYLDGLSSIQDTEPNKYWINIHHLYKSYLWFSDYSSWPTCLQEQWENETLCGVKDFALAETKLFSVRIGSDNGNEEASIVTELNGAIEEGADSETVSELLAVLSELRDQRLSNIDIEYENQQSIIENLDCEGNLQAQWKSTYLMLLQYLKNEEELTEENISELQYTASLCAKNYGESVHWARGILAEDDPTLYDNIDQCESDVESLVLSTDDKLMAEIINVFPNPTSGYLNIEVDYEGVIDYEIVDIAGKLVKKFSSSNQTRIDVSEFHRGLYLIKVIDKNNNKSTTKFVIK